MKSSDMLLLTPAAVCVVGVVAYALTALPLSRLCLLIAGLSLAAFALHWLLSRVRR